MGWKGQIGGEVVEQLGRSLYKTGIPDNAKRILTTFGQKDAQHYLDGINANPKLADELRTAIEHASEMPNSEMSNQGFKALTAGGGELNTLSQADQSSKRAINAYNRSKKLIEQAGIEGKGKVSRESKAMVSNPQETRGQQPGMIQRYQNRQRGQITEGDHGAGLDDNFGIIKAHPSFNEVQPGQPSILVQGLNMLGVEIGDSPKNINDILNNLTKGSRKARVSALDEQLGGVVHRDTLNARLGLSKHQPAELSGEQAVALNLFKKQNPGATRADFDVKWKEQTGKTLPVGSFGDDIIVYKPDGTTGPKRTELGKVSIKSESDKAKAMSRIFDILDANKIDTSAARKNYDMKKIKVDRNLDIYGFDHDYKHILINTAKKKRRTAIGAAEAAVKSGKVKELSNGEAFKLLIKSIQEQETILANQQLFRYEKIVELWNEDSAFKHLDFERQPAYVKQNFFQLNVNKIAVKGGPKQKLLTLNEALKPIEEWPDGAEEIFGWRPQTLDTSDAQIEMIAQKLDGVPNLEDMYQKGLERP